MNTTILARVDFLEEITGRLAAAVEAGTVQERSGILSLRREQEMALEALYDAVTQALAHTSTSVRSELEPQFHDHFQAMKRAILLHQGKWPSVLIASDPDGFVASARRSRQQKATMVDWIRRELLPRI